MIDVEKNSAWSKMRGCLARFYCRVFRRCFPKNRDTDRER